MPSPGSPVTPATAPEQLPDALLALIAPPEKGLTDMMNKRRLHGLAAAAAVPIPTPPLSISLLSGPAELAELCQQLSSAGRPVSLAFSTGPPPLKYTSPADTPFAPAPAPTADSVSRLSLMLPAARQPLCLTLSWWGDLRGGSASSTPAPATAQSLHCAILPLSSPSDSSAPSTSLNEGVAAALSALQPLLTRPLEAAARQHNTSVPRLSDPLSLLPTALNPTGDASAQRLPLVMTFGSKQLHRLLLSTTLPPAGPHVTDLLMATYLLDAHLPSQFPYVMQRHGAQAMSDIVCGIVNASPFAHPAGQPQELSANPSEALHWTVRSPLPSSRPLAKPAPDPADPRRRIRAPRVAADGSTKVSVKKPSPAYERVLSYFKSVQDHTAALQKAASKAEEQLREREAKSAAVEELLLGARNEATVTRETYAAESAAAGWRAESGAGGSATSSAGALHKRRLQFRGFEASKKAARRVEVVGNKVARFEKTLQSARGKVAAAVGAVTAWEGRPEATRVRGVELSTLAVCAAEAVQMQIVHGPMQVGGVPGAHERHTSKRVTWCQRPPGRHEPWARFEPCPSVRNSHQYPLPLPAARVVPSLRAPPPQGPMPLAPSLPCRSPPTHPLHPLRSSPQARLSSSPRSAELLQSVELPLQAVLARIEAVGVLVDQPELCKLIEAVTEKFEEAKGTCCKIAGLDVTALGYAAQHDLIQQLMRGEGPPEAAPAGGTADEGSTGAPEQAYESPYAGLPPLLAGQPGALTKEALQAFAVDSPLAKELLPLREMERLLKVCGPLQKSIDPRDGRIHATLDPTGAVSGRLSCKDPNLQTLPTKGKLASKTRAVVVATPGYRLLSADYSQIELRVIAQMSQDKRLLEHFDERVDVHTLTAQQIFGVSEVTAVQRAAAKNVIFGTLYGMGYRALAAQNSVKVDVVRQYIQDFREQHLQACEYMETIQKQALSQGYTETLFGRRCTFSFRDKRAAAMLGMDLKDIDLLKCYRDWSHTDQMLLRSASNVVIQGSAADIQKKAMLAVDEGLRKKNLDARILMSVHDELLLEVRQSAEDKETMKAAKLVLKDGMMNASGTAMPDVKLPVTVLFGLSWKDILDKKARAAVSK
ncbi:MAG: hypothetical protein WDW36_007120 [Sanguina aurantia]